MEFEWKISENAKKYLHDYCENRIFRKDLGCKGCLYRDRDTNTTCIFETCPCDCNIE